MVYKVADNILSPLGATTAENYQAVKAGRSALARHDQRWSLPDKVLTASLFSKEQEEQFLISGLSRFESMVVTSVREALSQTTLDVSQPNIILIISTTKGEVDSAQRISREFGFTTDPIIVCNACISGLSALILASRLLEDGQYDYAVVCGADSQSRFIVSGFQSLKALSPEPCRPFDMERLGLNLGEAAATIILGKGVGDWTLGPGAIRNDAVHISNPAKDGEGSCRALKAVVSDGDKASLAFINAHGTATFFNDQMESVAIERAGLAGIPVNAYKGCYGHTMGAAGVLETILSMAAIDDHTILATRGFEELGVSGRISVSASHQSTDKTAFVKMLSGFGGCNAALLLEKNGTRLTGGCHSPFSSHHSVVIRPDAVEVDGRRLPIDVHGPALLTALYRQYVGDYPKYYKMDPLSRLGFVASELLLQAEEGRERFVTCDDRAVVFFNHSSSVCADRQYMETIGDLENCFPSPSVFVYTLPNIVTGEIAIRNHYHGETSFYILPRRDDSLIQQVLHASCLDPATQSILCGWLDYEDDTHFEAHLKIVNCKSVNRK